MATTVYALLDPRSGAVCYIGRTARPLSKRMHGHWSHDASKTDPRNRFVRDMKALGLRVRGVELEVVDDADADAAEMKWIARFRATGFPLLNRSAGGKSNSGLSPSAETRARMSRAHVGLPKSENTIARLSASLRGLPKSEAHRRKLAESVARAAPRLKLRSNNTSGFKGVALDRKRGMWITMLKHDGKTISIGRFKTAEDAARAYDDKVRELFGSDAVFNFPREGEESAR